MINAPPREAAWISWAAVVVWTLILLATLPFARAIQRTVAGIAGDGIFLVISVGAVIIFSVAALGYLVRIQKLRPLNLIGLLCIAGLVIGLAVGVASPIESLHFIQYGILGLLSYRALCHRMHDTGIYFAAIILGTSVGIVDEAIQWALPGHLGPPRYSVQQHGRCLGSTRDRVRIFTAHY